MGYLLLNDTLVAELKKKLLSLKIVKDIQLLSGDNQNNVKRISAELGIENLKAN